MTSGLGGASSADRLLWLDVAKGIGIVFVVIGHALGGLIDSRLGMGLDRFRETFFIIYTFHMPLFFMLSGLTVARRVEAKPEAFRSSIAIDIVWPYFLWSIIQFTIIYQLGDAVNQPVSDYWRVVLGLPLHPVSQFWFLQALFVLHVAALLIVPRAGTVAFLILCIAMKPLILLLPLPDIIKLPANQALFYGLGVFLGVAGMNNLAVACRPIIRGLVLPVVAAGLIIAAVIAAPSFNASIVLASAKAAEIAALAWNSAVMPAALAGAFATVSVASLIGGRFAALLARLGQLSMAIFILHILAIAGTRIFLVSILGFTSPLAVLATTVSAGLIAPVIAATIAQRLGISRLIGLGRI